MTDTAIIRKATERDLKFIAELYQSLEDKYIQPTGVEIDINIFNTIKTYPNYSVYVAESDGNIIGTFALLIMDNLAHRGQPSAIVEDVAVKEECRGRGIGKKMMAYALQISKECGCYKMMLSSSMKRERAHKFYEEIGFEKHGYSFRVDLKEKIKE